jgi:hypothetical protein
MQNICRDSFVAEGAITKRMQTSPVKGKLADAEAGKRLSAEVCV